ncbi:CBL-interacting serine/threonine-protein kinase 25-like [Coffea arabica]|uniref:non-specific serine/threonine protein kinase n=1 Tax=Coffea arabica TaxID=13443 RepID=A0A6P6TVT0_COFAR
MGGGKILFDKYEMGKLLGKGTFAKVYHGKEMAKGESVAIKVIYKDQVKTEEMMNQITREISIMRLVRHQNIVEIKEVMATKTKIYFVMEYIKGGELFTKVARGRLKEDVARKYFQQLISAVDFCHSRGVVHRDLKPENLLLDENGELKVSDFGLSALPEQLRNDGLLHTQCGTAAYIAPEVLRKKGYDGVKADLWSCGVVLYVLLAGFLPFQDQNLMNMYRKIFKAEFTFPPWFSMESKRLISKLLVADPARRISIPAIMKAPWFRKNYSMTSSFSVKEFTIEKFEEEEEHVMRGGMRKSPSSPALLNAFQLISSMSTGFDLSSLFEIKGKSGSMFTSRCSANVIMTKIEMVAKKLNCKIARGKDFTLRLLAPFDGRKGRLLVTAEVFKVAPEVAVVEFLKSSGDTLEYKKFCEEEIRPALKDIIWTWQGDNAMLNKNGKDDLQESIVG